MFGIEKDFKKLMEQVYGPLGEKEQMTQLIDPSDPRYFRQTSDEPYLRHDYKLVMTNGDTIVFDNYEDVQRRWFESGGNFLSHVEVLDHKEPKNKKKKGF